MSANMRTCIPLNQDWVFRYCTPSQPDHAMALAETADADWEPVTVPHTWLTWATTGRVHPFVHDPSESESPALWAGWGWYRKRFSLSRKWCDRQVFAEFDGVQKCCQVFCNGRFAGEHKGGFSGFSVNLTPFIRWGAENVLAVAVSGRQADPDRTPPMYAGNWCTFPGIYRQARLVLTSALHIPFQGSAEHEGGLRIRAELSGRVAIETWVRNAGGTPADIVVRTGIAGAWSGEARVTVPPGAIARAEQVAHVPDPRWWHPDHPHLYSVTTEILHAGTVCDRQTRRFGIRTVAWDYDTNRLVLNGTPLRLLGSNLGQDWPWLGDAVPTRLLLADLQDMKYGLGMNCVRSGWFPPAPAVHDWCDEHGLLVMANVPIWKLLPFNRARAGQMVIEMVRQHRNHPSIFLWSLGNETDFVCDREWLMREDPTRIVHYRDVRAEIPADAHTHRNLAMENLLCCTVRGWPWHEARTYPSPLCDGIPAPASGQVTGTELRQHDDYLTAGLTGNPGQCIQNRDVSLIQFMYADGSADRHYLNAPLLHVNPKGLVDLYRVPKYACHLWRALYGPAPMVFIHPHFWSRQYRGQRREIVVNANAPSVELFVDGRSRGAQPVVDGVARFRDVLIEGRELTAVAGSVVATRRMPGPIAELRLTSDLPSLRGDVAVLTVTAYDADGTEVLDADPPLTWNVTGPARLLAPAEMTSDRHRHGELTGCWYIALPIRIPLQATGKAGQVIVTAAAPDVRSARIALPAELPSRDLPAGIIFPVVPPRAVAPPLADLAGNQIIGPLHGAFEDFQLGTDRAAVRQRIHIILATGWPSGVPGSSDLPCAGEAEFHALLDLLTDKTLATGGLILADDINCLVAEFNAQYRQRLNRYGS